VRCNMVCLLLRVMGFGMVRLTVLFTGLSTLHDVLFFPRMRPCECRPDGRCFPVFGTGGCLRVGTFRPECALQSWWPT